VNKTDRLRPDRRLLLLALRISVVDGQTGRYLAKSDPVRPVVAAHDIHCPYIIPVLTKARNRVSLSSFSVL
jgi:hypothetical protein